jgi:small subunit ribosomal protein S16
MAVKLRLSRFGAKKKPYYKVAAVDSRVRRDGRCLEWLGYYHPMDEPSSIKLDIERVDYWLGVGAQPTETVDKIIAIARKQVPAR